MTEKQAHILAHIDRVRLVPYKVQVKTPTIRRYQLDGLDCTQQIKGLLISKRIVMRDDGSLSRGCVHLDETGRQLPSLETLDLLRRTLLAASSVHRDPRSASAQARSSGASGNASAKRMARSRPVESTERVPGLVDSA